MFLQLSYFFTYRVGVMIFHSVIKLCYLLKNYFELFGRKKVKFIGRNNRITALQFETFEHNLKIILFKHQIT